MIGPRTQSIGAFGASLLAIVAGVSLSAEGDFEITRFTVDGGGAMFCMGRTLELSGTAGQPDAGVMTGGSFTLFGGFWFPATRGDCNIDGGVNLFDYGDFQECLTGPGASTPTPACGCYDLDRDQDVDLADVAEFQKVFTET
ncbi:MAG: hypothetical protein AABZ47_17660 [Planctomycetota bacterium]